MKEQNPWIEKEYKTSNGHTVRVGSMDVTDRLAALKGFGISRTRDAINYPWTQKTVRLAAERQLRKLTKELIKVVYRYEGRDESM